MLSLKIVDSKFPTVGACKTEIESIPVSGSICSSSGLGCTCPQRSAVPDKPNILPYKPVTENIPKMRAWLLNRYGSSTFNVCPHRPLHQMAGPPIEIHLDKDARPRACHIAAPVPLHWQKQVQEDLIRDEALGIIEKVPYGVPVQ